MINMGGPLLNIVQHGLWEGEVLHIHNKKYVETGGIVFLYANKSPKLRIKKCIYRGPIKLSLKVDPLEDLTPKLYPRSRGGSFGCLQGDQTYVDPALNKKNTSKSGCFCAISETLYVPSRYIKLILVISAAEINRRNGHTTSNKTVIFNIL